MLSAVAAGMPKEISAAPTSRAMVAPLKAPASTPTRVMPIWTEERNRPGVSISAKAVAAPALPARASACRRERRPETIASSDMERKPLNRISTRTSKASSDSDHIPSTAPSVEPRQPL